MSNKTAPKSLQDLIDATPDLVGYFSNDTIAPHVKESAGLTPVPAEFTNWRSEQRAWREAAVIFDQSHHMPELFISGKDAFAFLNRLGVNSFAKFSVGKAKQFIGCNHQGQVIGECVLTRLGEEEFELCSGMYFLNWIRYQAGISGFDLKVVYDAPTALNPNGRRLFRFGMDGPNAEKIFQDVVEGEAPEIAFFNTARVRIAGVDVLALRHGMAGHKGVELSGPFSEIERVRGALLEAGKKYGLKRGGTTTYFSACAEGGWMAYPLPAIFTAPDLADYRRALPADGWESRCQIGGSLSSSNIEDYYVTPFDMGYDRLVKFDHDFIGRAALEKIAAAPRWTAVTLVWDSAEVARIHASQFQEEDLPYRFMAMPIASYAFQQHDAVLDDSGQLVGSGQFTGYSVNERKYLTLAMVDRALAVPGTRLRLVWGEAGGGSRKPAIERHRQTEVTCTVAPAPYSKAVQQMRAASVARVG